MVNYAGNSHKDRAQSSEKPKQERRKVEKVTEGKVTVKKQTLGSKILETFTGDNLNSVGETLIFEVIIPKLKDGISEMFSVGIDRALYGESARSTTSRSTYRDTSRHTNYSSYSNNTGSRAASSRNFSRRDRASHNFEEITLETRGEAENVLSELCDLIDAYGTATVHELYELVDIDGEHTDINWGWEDLGRARVVRGRRGGFLLDLPKPIELDD